MRVKTQSHGCAREGLRSKDMPVSLLQLPFERLNRKKATRIKTQSGTRTRTWRVLLLLLLLLRPGSNDATVYVGLAILLCAPLLVVLKTSACWFCSHEHVVMCTRACGHVHTSM